MNKLFSIFYEALTQSSFLALNELKLTQIAIFLFFHIMLVFSNASELFCMAYLVNIERFLYHSKLPFSISNFM